VKKCLRALWAETEENRIWRRSAGLLPSIQSEEAVRFSNLIGAGSSLPELRRPRILPFVAISDRPRGARRYTWQRQRCGTVSARSILSSRFWGPGPDALLEACRSFWPGFSLSSSCSPASRVSHAQPLRGLQQSIHSLLICESLQNMCHAAWQHKPPRP
jgi:hypothetical protein